MGEVYGATVLVKGEKTTTQESLRKSSQVQGTTIIHGGEGRSKNPFNALLSMCLYIYMIWKFVAEFAEFNTMVVHLEDSSNQVELQQADNPSEVKKMEDNANSLAEGFSDSKLTFFFFTYNVQYFICGSNPILVVKNLNAEIL